MKQYTELQPWTGVIARLRVPTTDGRVIGWPGAPGTLWRDRMPIPLLCLQDNPSSCLAPYRVGHVQDFEVRGNELWAYGSIYLDAITSEGLAKTLRSGDLAEAGVDMRDVLTETITSDDGPLTRLTDWLITGLTIGPAYRSAWAEPCGIRVLTW